MLSDRTSLRHQLLCFGALGIWLGLCYALRFSLMENAHWVAVCDGKSANAMCSLRSAFGVVIHFQVLAWAALAFAVPAFFLRGVNGRRLAWLALIIAAPALALYTVALAVFAALIAGLRLVREERHTPNESRHATAAQPMA